MATDQELTAIKQALAAAYTYSDKGIKGGTPKLATETVREWKAEDFYMLAAICFDLSRRLYYLTEAMKPFRDYAESGFKQKVKRDNDAIHDESNDNWEKRARAAEKVLRRLAEESAAAEHAGWLDEDGGKESAE